MLDELAIVRRDHFISMPRCHLGCQPDNQAFASVDGWNEFQD
jgi:hypothetical protein